MEEFLICNWAGFFDANLQTHVSGSSRRPSGNISMKSRSLYVGDFLARSALLAWNTCANRYWRVHHTSKWKSHRQLFSHLSFVSGPLEVELEVHLDVGRQQVVHRGESDVLLIVHIHVHSEKLGQQSVWILHGWKSSRFRVGGTQPKNNGEF